MERRRRHRRSATRAAGAIPRLALAECTHGWSPYALAQALVLAGSRDFTTSTDRGPKYAAPVFHLILVTTIPPLEANGYISLWSTPEETFPSWPKPKARRHGLPCGIDTVQQVKHVTNVEYVRRTRLRHRRWGECAVENSQDYVHNVIYVQLDKTK